MRIKGPGDGPRPPDAVDEAAPVDGVDETAPAEEVASVGGPGGPNRNDPIGRIAERLRAGEIDADEAVELLIDDAVERQLGAAASKDLEDKLREVLRDYAANDPYLAARIRRLTQSK